jgi:hypothetical protein
MKYILKNGRTVEIITMAEDNNNCIYHHFKGNDYRVLYLAKHTETLDTYIVYQSIKEPNEIWIRAIDIFFEKVDKVKYPNINQEYRFEQLIKVIK